MSFGPFSTLPNSLPNFFGLTGQAMPKAMEENITPVLAIEPWLVAANCIETLIPPAVNIAAGGFTAIPGLTVPEGEAWVIRGIVAGWFTLVAQELRGRLCITRATGGGPIITELGSEGCSNLNEAAAVGQAWSSLPPGRILVPGDAVAFLASSIIAGPVPSQPQAAIFRFSV